MDARCFNPQLVGDISVTEGIKPATLAESLGGIENVLGCRTVHAAMITY
jgi:hypothetical protein